MTKGVFGNSGKLGGNSTLRKSGEYDTGCAVGEEMLFL